MTVEENSAKGNWIERSGLLRSSILEWVIRDQRSPDSDPHARFTGEEYRNALRLTLEWVEEGRLDIAASLSYVRVWGSAQQLRDNLDLLSELEKRLPQGLKDPPFPPVGGRLALLSRGEPFRPVRQALEQALSTAQDCEVFLEKEGWVYDAATRKLKLISKPGVGGRPKLHFNSVVQREYRLLTDPAAPEPLPPGNNEETRERIAKRLQVDFAPELLGTKRGEGIGAAINNLENPGRDRKSRGKRQSR